MIRDDQIKTLLIFAVCIFCLMVLFLFSGCVNPPEILKNNDGDIVEEQACFHWRLCLETARKTGQPLSACDKVYDACNRADIYSKCEKIADPVEKNNCWIKLK